MVSFRQNRTALEKFYDVQPLQQLESGLLQVHGVEVQVVDLARVNELLAQVGHKLGADFSHRSRLS